MIVPNPVSSVIKQSVEDDVNPDDSISNVGSQCSSHRSGLSKLSTTSSVRIQAEAERAALMARAAALKERHALEEREQQLRRQREELDLETELAASTAKLAVLQASELKGSSQASADGMNYLAKEKRKQSIVLNPTAKEFNPGCSTTRERTRLIEAVDGPSLPEVRRKTTEQWCKAVSSQWNPKEHRQTGLAKSLLFREPLLQEVGGGETEQEHDMASRQWHNFNEQQQITNALRPLQQISHKPTVALVEKEQRPLHHQQSDLLTVMHRQTEITATLVQQQNILSLPPQEIPTFEGDPLQYRAFIKAFEQGVERKAEMVDCLYYLEQFTRGRPQELVRSCQHMAPERGYTVARELLQEYFGNPYKIATAYMEKALTWQTIKTEDVESLQAYSLFLRGCCNVMEELPYVQELDMPVNMRIIISKLPFKGDILC